MKNPGIPRKERHITVSFIGHAFIPSGERVKELVKEQLQRVISAAEEVSCYLGRHGAFDEISLCACRELKKEYTGIELVYVMPYRGLAEIRELRQRGLYDAYLYPPLEGVPPRLAIVRRNEWMMKEADLVIAYVNHSYGGAYRALLAAKRGKKKIINICEFL